MPPPAPPMEHAPANHPVAPTPRDLSSVDPMSFMIEVMSEVGGMLRQNVVQQVSIDDNNLEGEAIDLPALIFYWTAAYGRMEQRIELTKHKLKKIEAEKYVAIREDAEANDRKITVEEIKARIEADDLVSSVKQELTKYATMAKTAKAMMDSLKQKGYSLQLISSMRMKELDWLQQSFSRRLADHPNAQHLMYELQKILDQM